MTKRRTENIRTVLFILYAAVTLTAALCHELWFDEAQAWCIVRDNDLAGIIRQLHYEGHPALWYLILLPFARLGLSCDVIPLISWAFSTAAAWIVVFRSPFSALMKTAVLLSGGFLFYNTVISRPYSLIQLLLCLIAVIYPERKKHPLLFGALIALLANTHVVMCGLVGFFGICMIAELFRAWKENTVKRNMLEAAGLVIEGIGVITLILPVIGSIGLNSMVTEPSQINSHNLERLLWCFSDTLTSAAASGFDIIPLLVVSAAAAVATVIFLIIFRYDLKCLAGSLTFTVFYMAISCLIWRNNTQRANIFILVLVMFYWISLGENERRIVHRTDGIKSGLTVFLLKFDENGKKSCGILLAAVLFSTAPAAAYTLVADISGDFSPSKAVAAYIRENFPPDTVLLSTGTAIPQVSAYLPEYRFYSAYSGRFITYDPHEKIYGDDPVEIPYFEKVCEVRQENDEGYLFMADGYIPFDVNYRYMGVYSYGTEQNAARG